MLSFGELVGDARFLFFFLLSFWKWKIPRKEWEFGA